MALQEWSKKVVKEIQKHAEVDGCQDCKKLLVMLAAAYGVSYEQLTKQPHN
jgi:hypothetical protein